MKKKNTKKIIWSVALLSTLTLVACGREPKSEEIEEQLVNPAAAYCIEQWWTYESVNDEEESYWVCSFSDYGVCEEWDFYNSWICWEYKDDEKVIEIEGNNEEELNDLEDWDVIEKDEEESVWVVNPASEFCEQLWWVISIVEWDEWEYWVCNFADWTSCEEWSLFNRECWVNKIPTELAW